MHYEEGQLKAYLDDALPPGESASMAAHLSGCAACRGHHDELGALAGRVGALVAHPTPTPQAHAALARLLRDQERTAATSSTGWRNIMSNVNRFFTGPRRAIAGGALAVALVASLFISPGVRAAADQFLSVFRVQTVVFVPVSNDRISQLQNLNVDPSSLFISQPQMVSKPADPRSFTSASDASKAVGFTIASPAQLPGKVSSTEYRVEGRSVMQAQVNVQQARQVLRLMGVNDVTIPDALGSKPIVATISPFVRTSYDGIGYDFTVIQGKSPTVDLPAGVNMAQLGKAALRLFGMDAKQADAMSKQINWSSTFVVPFPSGINSVRQVNVGGVNGMLVRTDDRANAANGGDSLGWVLYWQKGDRFFIAQGHMQQEDMIVAATSIR